MNAKKRIELKRFDEFTKFYNYLPQKRLNNSVGIGNAQVPYDIDDPTLVDLDIESLNLDRVDGVAAFKQFYKKSGNTQYRILVYGSDKKMYMNQMFNQDTSFYWLYDLTFESAPIVLAYKKEDLDTIILACQEEMKIWQTGYSPYYIENVPIITSMCMNGGVLFCTIKEPAFKIWYATDLTPENVGNISNNSGYISLEDKLGNAGKIITFNQDVYVFREYGISKINYYKSNISVSQVYESTTKIYSNTVSACGNVVLFMTSEGLYSFNGVKVSKINISVASMLENLTTSVAESLAGKYYVALRLNFEDDKKVLCENVDYLNNAILILDTNDNSYQIVRGVDVKSFFPLKANDYESMYLTFNSKYSNKLGQIINNSTCFGEPLCKYWASGELTENYNSKAFTKLEVKADKDVKFNLITDNKNISFTTYKTGINTFCFKLYAKELQISISSEKETAEVDYVAVDYYEN